MGHGALGMGYGVWGIGHRALGMGHGALGMGHWAWGRGDKVEMNLPCAIPQSDSQSLAPSP
ncbi:MAG: hypothetical protein VKL59_18400 [Nostocaceae cyanobacterium]|nr:hypothetical protein [Nostocaceae cyanobacterium]